TKPGDVDEEMTLVRMVMNDVITNANVVLNNPQEIVRSVQSGLTTDKIVDTIVAGLKGNEPDKFKYIQELNLNVRLKMLLEDVAKQKMVSELEQHINEEVKKSIDESQKEYYLREKMRAIQNELGDKARKEDEVDELREKILKAKMPKEIEEKALQELARYS